MPRRRSQTRALKSWSSALRAGIRLTRAALAAGQKLGQAAQPKTKRRTKKTTAGASPARPAKPAARSPVQATKALPKTVPKSPLRPGQSEAGRFRNRSGLREYLLHRPRIDARGDTRAPLVVLLHGCSQDAAAFARATRMAEHAGAAGCWTLFPEQTERSNRACCWNWFEPDHQRRGAGEPAILAGLVRKVVREHQLDQRRVFVAGLSAGGAMAVVLGRTYPELFAAVGVYAGMPYGAARTATTALLAMRGRHRPVVGATDEHASSPRPMRTIVFQGDRDRTVVRRNTDAVTAQALAAFGATTTQHDTGAAGGRSYERVRHITPGGVVAVEHWTIRGAGHAWSGGAVGAFSDTTGPDASAAMMDFFLRPLA